MVCLYFFAIYLFPFSHIGVEFQSQSGGVGVLPSVKVYLEYGMLIPFLFQSLHGKSFEQFLPAPEVAFQHTNQQTLAKPAQAAQEIDSTCVHKVIYQCGLVCIDEAPSRSFSKLCMPMGYFIIMFQR